MDFFTVTNGQKEQAQAVYARQLQDIANISIQELAATLDVADDLIKILALLHGITFCIQQKIASLEEIGTITQEERSVLIYSLRIIHAKKNILENSTYLSIFYMLDLPSADVINQFNSHLKDIASKLKVLPLASSDVASAPFNKRSF